MKTLASFSQPFEAHLLIARLESSGIPAFARDENLVTLDWLYSNAVGGVKVDVADEDFERAMELLTPEPEPVKPGPLVPRKPARRYVLLFLVSFVVGVGYAVALTLPQTPADLVKPLVLSALAAGSVAAVGALLRL